jgi:two-component system, NarL family, response regulator DevR
MTSPNTQRPITLMLVDDSELVRMGLRTLLTPEVSIQLVGEAANVAQAVEVARKTQPDVVLMDIRLPDGTGFDACRRILEFHPKCRVLFLTSVVDDKLVDEAIRSGGHGYLLKEINGRGLVQAIADVAVGKSILDPAVTARVMRLVKTGGPVGNGLDTLSPQERRVLALIAEGKTNKEVANDLGLSEKTVKNYLANAFDKLNVTRRSQAVALFVSQQRS